MKPTRDQLQDVLASIAAPSLRYADIRYTETDQQDVRIRNGEVDHLTSTIDRAVGIRVLVGNGWGFAATSDVGEPSIRKTARRAMEVAAASNIATTDNVRLSEVEPVVATWRSEYRIDPWSIPLDRKIEHLLAATEPMRGDPRIHQVSGDISSYRQEKLFASTIGSFIEQATTQMGGGIEAVAIEGDEFQRRTYPNPFGGDFQAAGWEFIEQLDLPKKAFQIRDEAIALLHAPKAPAGRFDLIVGSSQLALQVHESCGHPTELDRAFGSEISLAGGSFLQPEHARQLRYGSDLVNIVADATAQARPRHLRIRRRGGSGAAIPPRPGRACSSTTSRAATPRRVIGRRSNGTMRADG